MTNISWSQEVVEEIVTESEETAIEEDSTFIRYWNKGAYNHWPKEIEQEEPLIKDESFQDFKQKYSNSDFDYTDKKYEGITFLERVRKKFYSFIRSYLPGFSKATGNVIIYIFIFLGVCAIIFAIYRLFFAGDKLFQTEKREDNLSSEIEFVEKNLEQINIDLYIQKALDNQQWNEAIRYLQLANLQLLAKKGLIEWDYRKTNLDFLYEIKDEQLKKQFKNTSTVFNYVWFGDFEMDLATFQRFQNDFLNLKKELS